jgi:hypothetical protein
MTAEGPQRVRMRSGLVGRFDHHSFYIWTQSRRRCRRCDPNVLLMGPPGAGQSMRARRLNPMLPAMGLAEALETTRIPHIAGRTGARTACITTRPFRALTRLSRM